MLVLVYNMKTIIVMYNCNYNYKSKRLYSISIMYNCEMEIVL